MQKGGSQICSHPLSKGKFPGRLIHKFLQSQNITEIFHILYILFFWYFIYLFQQPKGLLNRNIPPKLSLLSKNNTYFLCIFDSVRKRILPHNFYGSSTGMHNSCKHFDGCRFSCPIGSQKGHTLSLGNLKANPLYRRQFFIPRAYQMFQTSHNPCLFFGNFVILFQIMDFYSLHNSFTCFLT